MTPNIPDMVAKLKQGLAALGDGRDAKSDNERATYRRAYDAIQREITGLMNAPDDLARAERRLAEPVSRRAAVVQKLTELTELITNAPDWRTVGDGRACDKEYDRQRNLQLQLRLLHEGRLLMAPGVTYERLADLDARIAELTERRDRAQRALDGHLQAAATLVGEQPVSS
jgi:hypothetical protein